MSKIEAPTESSFRATLAKRLKYAKAYRQRLVETQWQINEQVVYFYNSRKPQGVELLPDDILAMTPDHDAEHGDDTVDMSVNYAWKFLRFIHSQMSANPPSVIARPTSPDNDDRAKADAADRVVRHGYQEKDVQELFDQQSLKTLSYGNGWVRCVWDQDAGEGYDFDEQTDELTMDGDINAYSPSTWDVWLDPDAKAWKKVRYIFERIEMPIEEAKFSWRDEADVIERYVKKKVTTESILDDHEREDIVEIYCYTEKGMPLNGMAGRHCYCLEDGTILGGLKKNENPGAALGYTLLTDIDVPDQVYGKSFVEYIFKLQDLLNRLDTAFVDNVASHGVVRLVLPEGADIEDKALSNSAWDYVKITGNAGVAPYFVPAAQIMPDVHKLRENLVQGIQEMAGVNDSMLGQVNRELSGFAVQTAIDAGNQCRRRLFNKYTQCVRDFWRSYLGNVVKYWNDPRTITVLGKEKAFEAADLRGADVSHGYDFVVEYGASLSLDPARRREEIMQLMPIFEKAGIPDKTILSMLRLNELDALYDRTQLSADRQREIFEKMLATGQPIDPRDLQDHAGMLDYAYTFVMSAEYRDLGDEEQQMIDDHIKKREQMAAQAATKGQADPAAAAAAAGGGGAPPPMMAPAAPPSAIVAPAA